MNIVRNLEKLLNEEHALLLAGDFEGLSSLVEKKLRLESRLSKQKSKLNAEDCARLTTQAKHNEALLSSAQSGLQSAILQLRQLREGESQKIYSKDRQRKSLSRASGSIAQKV